MTLVVVFAVVASAVLSIQVRPPAACGDLLLGVAHAGVGSAALLCMLGLVVGTPAGLVLGALSGFGAAAALWVLRCPTWAECWDGDDGRGGGGGDGPEEPVDPPDGSGGGVAIDWDAVELEAYNAWRDHTHPRAHVPA